MATVQENLHCWFNYDATKPNVIENRICEGTDCLKAALSSGVTSLQFTIASAKSVSGGSNEAVTLLNLVPWASTLTYRVNHVNSKKIRVGGLKKEIPAQKKVLPRDWKNLIPPHTDK